MPVKSLEYVFVAKIDGSLSFDRRMQSFIEDGKAVQLVDKNFTCAVIVVVPTSPLWLQSVSVNFLRAVSGFSLILGTVFGVVICHKHPLYDFDSCYKIMSWLLIRGDDAEKF